MQGTTQPLGGLLKKEPISMLWAMMVSAHPFKLKTKSKNLVFAGFTPLMKAADVGNEEIARILIEKRANVNAINNNGDSALILAVINSKIQF